IFLSICITNTYKILKHFNMHDRLALNWQTPFKRSEDGVLGCPSLLLSGQRQASSAYPSLREVARSLSF
ncbi:MAG: hypothetical protein J6I72_04380, partial [Muribaculaceae bacterium]|nr:hypothetical protein [Muribaculaceae bacterium]